MSEMTGDARNTGRTLAMAAAVLLIIDCAVLLVAGSSLLAALRNGADVELLSTGIFPVAVYLAWALGVAGTISAILAITLHGFRERWFWRCLVVAAVIWLLFPPVFTVIGLMGLIVLIHSHADFPPGQVAVPRMP